MLIHLNSFNRCLKELSIMAPTRASLSQLDARIRKAVTLGSADWFSRIAGGRRQGGPICDDDRLENTIRICQSLMTDLQTVLTVHHPVFDRVWQIPAFNLVYLYYESQLADVSKPVVDSISRVLKSIQVSHDQVVSLAFEASGEIKAGQVSSPDAETIAPRLSMGTALFELYLCLQQFHKSVAFYVYYLIVSFIYKGSS